MIAFHNRLAGAQATLRPSIQKLFDSLVMLDASDRAGGLMSHYQINANTDATDVENMGSGLQYTFDPY